MSSELEKQTKEPFSEKGSSKIIYCEAKKHLHFAGPPLDCEICRWKDDCKVHQRLEVAEQLQKDANKLAEKYNELCDKFENEHGKNTNLEGRLKQAQQLTLKIRTKVCCAQHHPDIWQMLKENQEVQKDLLGVLSGQDKTEAQRND